MISAAIGGRSTKFELLSTETDPTEPIFFQTIARTSKGRHICGSEKQRGTECRAGEHTTVSTTTKQSVVTENLTL